jgi:hypothetical protein
MEAPVDGAVGKVAQPATVAAGKNGDGAAPKEFQLQVTAQSQTPPELALQPKEREKSVYDLKPNG